MTTAPGGGPALAASAAPLCNGARDAYVAAMAIFPRPVSPRSAIADLLDMFSPDRPHRWSLLALSATMTGILLWGFMIDSRRPPKEREIFYVENWMSDRKDSDIIRRQIEDINLYERALAKKQVEYQKLADSFGIEWREEEARNKAQRQAVIAAIKKRLDQRLADAVRKEAASIAAPAAQAAP